MSGNSCTSSCAGTCDRLYPTQTQQINLPAGFTDVNTLVLNLPYCTAHGCDNLALTASDFTFVGLCLRQSATNFYNITDVNGPGGVLPFAPATGNPAYFRVQVENITPSHITLRLQWRDTGVPVPYDTSLPGILCLEYWAVCSAAAVGCCPDPQITP